ncbi:hypothetical protein GCM10027160_49660 [Streptomyces calidiresistens]
MLLIGDEESQMLLGVAWAAPAPSTETSRAVTAANAILFTVFTPISTGPDRGGMLLPSILTGNDGEVEPATVASWCLAT